MNSVEDNAAKQYELPKWEFNRNADPKEIDLQNKIIVLSRAGTDIQLIISSILSVFLDPSNLLLNRKRVIVCSKRKGKNVDSNAPKTSISKWNRPPKRCSRWPERSKTSFSTKVSSKKCLRFQNFISAPMYLHPHRPKMIWHQLGENKNFKITFKNYEIATNNFSQIMTMRHHQLHVHQ